MTNNFEAPKPKKKVLWRVIYPLLIWYGVEALISFAYSIYFSIAYIAEVGFDSFGAYSEALMEDMTNYIMQKVNENSIMMTLLMDIITFGILLLFYLADKKGKEADNPLASPNIRKPIRYVCTATCAVGSCIGFNVVVSYIAAIFMSYGIDISQTFEETQQIINMSNPVLIAIASVIVAPLAEEMIFRGMIFKRLRGRFGFAASAVISSVLFGLVHGNVIQFIYAFAIGFMSACLFELTHEFFVSILFHMAANLISEVLSLEAVTDYASNLMYGYTFFPCLVLCGIAVLTGILAVKNSEKPLLE